MFTEQSIKSKRSSPKIKLCSIEDYVDVIPTSQFRWNILKHVELSHNYTVVSTYTQLHNSFAIDWPWLTICPAPQHLCLTGTSLEHCCTSLQRLCAAGTRWHASWSLIRQQLVLPGQQTDHEIPNSSTWRSKPHSYIAMVGTSILRFMPSILTLDSNSSVSNNLGTRWFPIPDIFRAAFEQNLRPKIRGLFMVLYSW